MLPIAGGRQPFVGVNAVGRRGNNVALWANTGTILAYHDFNFQPLLM
jgi:hypothetical protein